MANPTTPRDGVQNTAADDEGSPTAENSWRPLAGIGAEVSRFPIRARFEGEGIVVLRTKHGYRGVQRSCPHLQGTMMNAELAANDTMVRCPLHAFTFKLSDGKGVNCPGFRIKVYEVKEEGGTFYAKVAN